MIKSVTRKNSCNKLYFYFMDFFVNEKAVLIDKSHKNDFMIKIERILLFEKSNPVYEYSYNNGMDFGFTYKEYLRKPTIEDRCNFFESN